MAKMVNPELEVVRFENEDVIAGYSSLYWNDSIQSFTDRQGNTVSTASIKEQLWDGTNSQYTTASEFVNSYGGKGKNYDWRWDNGSYMSGANTYGSGS